MQTSAPHKIVVDILDAPMLDVGIRLVSDILRSYSTSKYFNPTIIQKYAKKINNRASFKRLGVPAFYLKTKQGRFD